MTPEYLVEQTNFALGQQPVLQMIFQKSFQYDSWIKEEFQGNYEILPETIFPFRITEQNMISIVKARVTRDGRDKLYSFLFIFSNEGLVIELTHPGQSNTDPILFRDVSLLARASAAAELGTDEIILKETFLVGDITGAGWTERWQWTNQEGKIAETEISFSASEGQGVAFNLKAA